MSNIDSQKSARAAPFLEPAEQDTRIRAAEQARIQVTQILLEHGPTRAMLIESEIQRACSIIQKASVRSTGDHKYALGSLQVAGELSEAGDASQLASWVGTFTLIPAWLSRTAAGHPDPAVQSANRAWRLAINRLIEPYMPLVHRVASDCRLPLMDLDDRIQQGALGLIEAAECVCAGRASFGYHARPYIHGSIAKAAQRVVQYGETTRSLEDWDMASMASEPDMENPKSDQLTDLLDNLPADSRHLLVRIYGLYRHPDVPAKVLAAEAGVSFQRIYQLREKAEQQLAQAIAVEAVSTSDLATAA